ncbi:MAG TPA: hypothetical protein PKV27_03625 [Ilumatobacteraceae bacterium]|nr:hypothetical protein [Ilumatobacteraceae bacterium]
MNDQNPIDPIEQFDLGQRLSDAVASATPHADLDAVLVGARRARVRRRAAGGLAVAGLIAVAGFGGYQLGNERQRTSVAAPTDVSTDVSTVDTSSAAGLPTTVPATGLSTAPAATVPDDVPAATAAPGANKSVDGSSADEHSLDSNGLYSSINPRDMKQVAERSVDGVSATLHILDYGDQLYEDGAPNGWKPPKWCNPTGGMQVRVAARTWIDILDGPWYSELHNGTRVASGVAGATASDPARIAVVQVTDPAVTGASIRYTDGATDSASVQNGYVILIVASEGAADGVVSFDGGDHQPADLASATAAGSDPSCQPPPPALPAPGEQPSDPAAAEAAVRDVAARVFDGKPDLANEFDDVTGLQDAIDKVQAGQYASAASEGRMEINGIVFTSPTEAWIRYDLQTGNGTFPNHFGKALLIDGAWKLTRQTLCQELALASVQCVPSAGGSIQPPTGG